MTKFDRTNLRVLRNRLDAVLKEFGDENGIEFKLGGFRFSDHRFTTKVECVTKVAGDARREMVDTKFADAVREYSLRMVSNNGDVLEQTYNHRAKEYPFTYATKRGTRYRASLMTVIEKFGTAESFGKYFAKMRSNVTVTNHTGEKIFD